MALYTLEALRKLEAQVGDRETPFLIMDIDRLRENCRRYLTAFKGADVYFAVKANNDPRILTLVFEEGLNFDVASQQEITQLSNLGVPSERMMFSAPTKIPAHIAFAYQAGVKRFAFDSEMEIDKLSQLAPGSQVFARLVVSNDGSKWPLERKFGITCEQALQLIPYAMQKGLQPYGLTFHVGSQNESLAAWERALEQVHVCWNHLRRMNIHLPIINIGGGYPIQYTDPVVSIEEIAGGVLRAAHDLFGEEVHLVIEPGRGLVGDIGVMVSSVINRAQRGDQTWLYLDTGVFHGLVEGMELFGFPFPVLAEREGNLQPFVLAGPTCDSADVISHQVMLPTDMTLYDRVFLLCAGAYTNSLENYNGLQFAPVRLAGWISE